jgi:predicted N-acyltransferase
VRDTGYFRKVGRRYVPVLDWNHPFEPADGVWLVVTDGTGRRRSRAFRLGDVPDVMVGAAFARHRDLIATTLNNTYDKHKNGVSAFDLAEAIVLAVAAAESRGGKP